MVWLDQTIHAVAVPPARGNHVVRAQRHSMVPPVKPEDDRLEEGSAFCAPFKVPGAAPEHDNAC